MTPTIRQRLLSSSYLARWALMNAVNATDYKDFPARPIANAAPAFEFTSARNHDDRFTVAEYSVKGVRKSEPLDQFLNRTGTSAFLVIQNDNVLYEKYFNGYRRDSIVTSFSVAKSFVSALIGIAVDEGLIRSLDDAITTYLPDLRGDHWRAISIRHLVSMSSGLRYRAGGIFPWDDEPHVYYALNLRQLAMQARASEAPGQNFHYNNFNLVLLGMVLERITGDTVSHYLQEKIWTPLGMEFPASWSLDSEQSGMEKMESGLNAHAIDFAKFGRLYLRRGNWNGQQIVPEHWVMESTRVAPDAKWTNYKYLWWIPSAVDEQFMAVGNLGQFIFIAPRQDLMILRFGERGGIPGWQRLYPGLFKNMAQRLRQPIEQ